LSRAKQATLNKVRGSVTTVTYELDILTKAGKRITVEVSTRLIHRGGEPVAVQGIARDISERRKVEQALTESETKFRTLAENAPCAILIHQDDHLVYANQKACQFSGYSLEELLSGDKIWDLVSGVSREMLQSRLEARNRGKRPLTI